MTQSTTHSASGVPLPSPKERRRLREAKPLSEEQVATAIGVTRATVRSWEAGRTSPRGHKREAYAKLLADIAAELGQSSAGEEDPPSEASAEPEPARTPAPGPAPGHEPGPEPAPASAPSADPPAHTKPAPVSRTSRTKESGGANTRPMPAVKRAAKPPAAVTSAVPAKMVRAMATVSVGPAPASPHSGTTAPPSRKTRAQRSHEPVEATETTQTTETTATTEPPAALTAEEAFDALYSYAAPALVRQTFVLTGLRRLSEESVERAFHLAWQNWPEVAVDRDPVGWVRAAAYEYAVSPWHRLRRVHQQTDESAMEPHRRALLDALLELPPSYRRTLLLYDGLGLDLPETAAETEASTPATANRVLHARAAITERLPELSETEVLHDRLMALASSQPVSHLAPARTVRTGSERRARFWTRTTIAVTALIIGATVFTAATAPTRYRPQPPPGEQVAGVPAQPGPLRLTPQDSKLRTKLLSEPVHGPERLVPQIR